MEQATNQLQKLKPAANQSPTKSILYVNSFLTISCIVFLLVSNDSLNRRLDSLEHNLDAIVDELKALKAEQFVYHKKGFGEQCSLKRRERGLRNESLTVLQGLSHRVWVSERETTTNLSSRLQGLTRRVRVLETNRTESTASFNEPSGRVDTLESRILANLSKYLEVNTPRGRNGRDGREGRLGPRGLPGPKGLMASCYHNHYGGGLNFSCLTNNSKSDKLLGGIRLLTTHISTAEVKSRGSQMMIPATNECPAGWTREYSGYLMSSLHSGKHSTEFVCIDADPEVAPGHKRGTDGAQLYVVAGQCGALPCCKPYIINYELTCVVCTK